MGLRHAQSPQLKASTQGFCLINPAFQQMKVFRPFPGCFQHHWTQGKVLPENSTVVTCYSSNSSESFVTLLQLVSGNILIFRSLKKKNAFLLLVLRKFCPPQSSPPKMRRDNNPRACPCSRVGKCSKCEAAFCKGGSIGI